MSNSWSELEAEWLAGDPALLRGRRRTDLVAMLRGAQSAVDAFIDAHAEEVDVLRRRAMPGGEISDDAQRSHTAAGEAEETGAARRRPRDESPSRASEPPPRQQRCGHCAQMPSADANASVLTNWPGYAELYERLIKIQAPMVRCSRPPFRQLCRRWGVDISYTHMIVAESFVNSTSARHADFALYSGEDRLVVQLAAKSGPTAAAAARLLMPYCDAIDLNCGCPQRWAMREGFGSALLAKPALVADMVASIRNAVEGGDVAGGGAAACPLPCVVKMRVQDDVRASVDFARQVAAAGAAWVTVHGRTPADAPSARVRWESIQLICDVLQREFGVPVVANGDVASPSSAVLTALGAGVGSVMAGNGLLDNPAALWLPTVDGANEATVLPLGGAAPGVARGPPFALTFSHARASLQGSDASDPAAPFTPTVEGAAGLVHEHATDGPNHAQQTGAPCECTDEGGKEWPSPLWRNVTPHAIADAHTIAAEIGPNSRPLWGLPLTPREVISDYLRAALRMDLNAATTNQQVLRMARLHLSPAERVHIAYVRSNAGLLLHFHELGLYTPCGRIPA